MFSENEIATLIEIPEVLDAVSVARKEFITKEANFLEISEHDFLSLVMMTPTVGIALANGSLSLFEELALNKMARKMSKGGYFLKIDPVAHAMKFLIKNFQPWEDQFYHVIKVTMGATFDKKRLMNLDSSDDNTLKGFARDIMNAPYIFVRYLSSFFLHDESDVVDERSISQVEFEKIKEIGHKLELDKFPVFQSFCNTFKVK